MGDARWNRTNNITDMPASRRKLQFGPGEFPQSMEKVEEEEGNDNVQQDSLDKRRVRRETDCDDRMVDMAPPSEPNVPDVDICYESENLRKKREEHSGIGPGGVKRKKKATLEPVTDQDDHGEDDGVFCGEDVANDEEETAQKKKQMKQWRQPRSEEDAGVEQEGEEDLEDDLREAAEDAELKHLMNHGGLETPLPVTGLSWARTFLALLSAQTRAHLKAQVVAGKWEVISMSTKSPIAQAYVLAELCVHPEVLDENSNDLLLPQFVYEWRHQIRKGRAPSMRITPAAFHFKYVDVTELKQLMKTSPLASVAEEADVDDDEPEIVGDKQQDLATPRWKVPPPSSGKVIAKSPNKVPLLWRDYAHACKLTSDKRSQLQEAIVKVIRLGWVFM